MNKADNINIGLNTNQSQASLNMKHNQSLNYNIGSKKFESTSLSKKITSEWMLDDDIFNKEYNRHKESENNLHISSHSKANMGLGNQMD